MDVELTVNVNPDARAIAGACVIVTTPEKWYGVSRSSHASPVLEVIVSRANLISSHTEQGLHMVGLSTALANARDLADWLGISHMELCNFRLSVRPVLLECHVSVRGWPS